MTLNDLVTKLNTIWGTFEDITDTTDTKISVFVIERLNKLVFVIIDKDNKSVYIDDFDLSKYSYDKIYEHIYIKYIGGG